MDLTTTARKAIEAYGGLELWLGARRIEAEVSAGGLAFALKRRPPFVRARIEMEVAQPRSKITPIGRDPARMGALDGLDVRLEGAGGEIVETRSRARTAFSGWCEFRRNSARDSDLKSATVPI